MKISRLQAFTRNCQANIAITFALTLPVLVAGTGIAIDMSRLFAADLNVQKSLDAAALAAAKEFGKTQDPAALTKIAEAYFYVNAGKDASEKTVFHFDGVTTVNGNSVMKVSATRNVPMTFGAALMSLFGGPDKRSYDLKKASEIVVQNRSIEMALVLDNSGSMKSAPAGGSTPKITTLKSATTDLVNQMMAAKNANVQYPVAMSVVPFSGAVNIGNTNADASWMDTKGLSPSHHDDFDWSTWKSLLGVPQAIKVSLGSRTYWTTLGGQYLTRFYLYNNMRNREDWAGCVQSRPNGYAITDDAPTESNPATLFVPSFAPSEHNWNGSLASLKNDYFPDSGGSTNGKTDLEALRKQRDMNKYFSGISFNSDAGGPNEVCNTKPLTPLTKSQSTVLSAVSSMEPLGGTNIMEGLAWGWRTLSSRLPFAEGKPAKTEDNLKILVLMTDGENTYNASYSNGEQVDMPNGGRSMFGTYGYAQFVEKDILGNEVLRTGRMFDSTKKTVKKADIDNVTDAMNENMSAVCENIKADGRNDDGSDGIVIFTIAFDLKDGSPVKERLRACASSGVNGQSAKLYYDAKSSSDLTTAFSSITEEISSLRIAR
jgi:Flp pilus assembly protein TadG